MNPTTQPFTLVLTTLVIILIAFLIGRELVCWYWKINRSIQLLEGILAELKQSNGKLPK
jgi:hypothetical protein